MWIYRELCVGYLRPDTVAAALDALAGGASVIAGGTDWYPARGEAPLPSDLLDITEVPGFSGISRDAQGWRFGAATTWSAIAAADLPAAFDGLRAAAREVGSIQIQNAGTLGGNLCNASPAADGMPPLLALDAQVELTSASGTRVMGLADFVTGVRQTALAPGELLSAVLIPDPGAAGASFVKLGARKYLVISIAMVSAVIAQSAGQVTAARVAVGACSPVARRLTTLEAALIGVPVAQAPALVAADHMAGLAPITDVRGSTDYRMDVATEMCARAIAIALGQEATHG